MRTLVFLLALLVGTLTAACLHKKQERAAVEVLPRTDGRVLRVQQQQPVKQHQCHQNVITYFIPKKDLSNHMDVYVQLTKSLDLLHQNFLSLNRNLVTVFFFHNGDFTDEEAINLQSLIPGVDIRLVNLDNTPFWELPESYSVKLKQADADSIGNIVM